MVMADRFLGPRAKLAYAYQSLKATGAEMVFGSDTPVEPVNPFHGLHAAITRRQIDGTPGPEGWQPQERLSLADALDGFSWAPARISGRSASLGHISPGAAADLILLRDNPFQSNPHDLWAVEPLATMLAGEWVFCHSDLGIEI
jgi:predicted amidohydrolase YtcJ